VDIDVSRYNAATADASLRERVLAWRKKMNAALPEQTAKPTTGKLE